MRSRISSLRSLISLFVAVVFAIAVTPGSMAMPAPQQTMKMDCASMSAPSCDHMKSHKDQGKPCKNMAVCLGMLSCFGMAAIATQHFTFSRLAMNERPLVLRQIVSGLTIPPDDRPPIA
jgi:hypothetical protein